MDESPWIDVPQTGANTAAYDRPSPWRTVFKVLGVLSLTLVVLGIGALYYIQSVMAGTFDPRRIVPNLTQTASVVINPRDAFPNHTRLTVLCLGLDRNIMISKDPKLNGMPYTKDARSDVMMVVGLDLVDQSVSILSIPRDTEVVLPRRRSISKINEAHARGGIPYTRETVEGFIEAPVDHHVVIKQEAIEAIIDALGGLKLNVEKDMDYDDDWGNLHIHLKEGEKTLTGKEVVGYMRFRKDNEGDFGRIRRQQQVIQALAEQAKSPAVILKADGVLKAIARYIQTDLTFNQQLALAHLFHKIQPANVQTVQMPVEDTTTIDKVSYVIPDKERMEAAVDWVVRGNREAMNRLIRIQLKNTSGSPELYQEVYRALRYSGFQVTRAGRVQGEVNEASKAVQHGKLRGAARRVLESLGLSGDVQKDDESQEYDVTLYVGKDLEGSTLLAMADGWEEPAPEPRRASRRRRRARSEEAGVSIRTAPNPDEEPESANPDEPASDPDPAESPSEPAPGPDAPATE